MKKILSAISVFFCTMILTAASAAPATNNAETNFNTGVNYHQRGNFTEAVKYFRLAAEQGYAGAQYN